MCLSTSKASKTKPTIYIWFTFSYRYMYVCILYGRTQPSSISACIMLNVVLRFLQDIFPCWLGVIILCIRKVLQPLSASHPFLPHIKYPFELQQQQTAHNTAWLSVCVSPARISRNPTGFYTKKENRSYRFVVSIEEYKEKQSHLRMLVVEHVLKGGWRAFDVMTLGTV